MGELSPELENSGTVCYMGGVFAGAIATGLCR